MRGYTLRLMETRRDRRRLRSSSPASLLREVRSSARGREAIVLRRRMRRRGRKAMLLAHVGHGAANSSKISRPTPARILQRQQCCTARETSDRPLSK